MNQGKRPPAEWPYFVCQEKGVFWEQWRTRQTASARIRAILVMAVAVALWRSQFIACVVKPTSDCLLRVGAVSVCSRRSIVTRTSPGGSEVARRGRFT